MTLTAPNCPVAESLPVEVKESVKEIQGIKDCEVELTFDPPWDKDMMSEEAMLDLGFL
jgi:metal-sulfur cluster biosynthetic enzyme